MGNPDLKRIEAKEGAYTFVSPNMSKLMLEIDARLNGANVYATFTYTTGLITKIEHFRDLAKTSLAIECQLTYVVGIDGISRIDTMTNIYYELDGVTEDSRVTVTLTRNGNDQITVCDSPFTTTESIKL